MDSLLHHFTHKSKAIVKSQILIQLERENPKHVHRLRVVADESRLKLNVDVVDVVDVEVDAALASFQSRLYF